MEGAKPVNVARNKILGNIKDSLDALQNKTVRKSTATNRLANPPKHLVPNRAQGDRNEIINLFVDMAEEVATTTTRIFSLDALPKAVSDYLARHNLPSRIKTDGDPLLENLDWESQSTLEVESGKAENDDLISVTVASAAVAETGTSILTSGQTGPTTLNFLPENHIIVLPISRLCGTYEESWEYLRERNTGNNKGLPRTINWVSGPSRTGDIEQTMQLGIHGPKRLHVILVNDDGEETE